MINLILTLAQLYFDKSPTSSDSSGDFISQMKGLGKDFLTAFVMYFLAMLFIFAGLVVFIIELGLQIDKGQLFYFSGLVISSLILISASVLCIIISIFVLKEPKVKEQPKEVHPIEELKQEVFNIALMFLREFKDSHTKSKNIEQT